MDIVILHMYACVYCLNLYTRVSTEDTAELEG